MGRYGIWMRGISASILGQNAGNGYQPYYAEANGFTGVVFESQNGTEISFAFPAIDGEIVQFSVYSPYEETARAYARDLFSSISYS